MTSGQLPQRRGQFHRYFLALSCFAVRFTVMGGRPSVGDCVADRPGHDFHYTIDWTKIGRELDWKPEERFETGMRMTIQWYPDNRG